MVYGLTVKTFHKELFHICRAFSSRVGLTFFWSKSRKTGFFAGCSCFRAAAPSLPSRTSP